MIEENMCVELVKPFGGKDIGAYANVALIDYDRGYCLMDFLEEDDMLLEIPIDYVREYTGKPDGDNNA